VHLVGFIIRIYHDARSHERQTLLTRVDVMVNILGIPCYNTELVFFNIDKTVKITNSVKTDKTGCFCVDECSLYIVCSISIFMTP